MIRWLLAFAVLLLACRPVASQTPEDIVRWVYSSLSGDGAGAGGGLDFLASEAQRDSYFTRRMVDFFAANESHGDNLAEACIDFGIAVPGQDFDASEILSSLRLTSNPSAQSVSIVADFTTFGQPARIVYDFVSEDGFWKIDDISGPGFRLSAIPCTAKATPEPSAQSYCYSQGDDTLRLDVSGAAAWIEVSSWQANGHSCFAALEGQSVATGWDFRGEDGCILQVRVTAEQGLLLSDPDWICKTRMCGQRAVLDGLSFPRSSQIDCAAWSSSR